MCAHLVNIGMEQKTELGSMQNFTLLKTTIWWFSEVFFLRQTQLQPILMHFETDVHGVEIRLRCFPFNAMSFHVFQESQKNMSPVSDNSFLGKPRYELHLEVVPPAVPCWYLQGKCFLKEKKTKFS